MPRCKTCGVHCHTQFLADNHCNEDNQEGNIRKATATKVSVTRREKADRERVK